MCKAVTVDYSNEYGLKGYPEYVQVFNVRNDKYKFDDLILARKPSPPSGFGISP